MSSENSNLSVVKILAVVIALLCAFFDITVVMLHLMGRLAGMSKIGVVGTIGVGIVAIACAWIACDKKSNRSLIAAAIVGEVILTTVSLINAGIAMDIEWQDLAANKAVERSLTLEKARNEERRKDEQLKAQTLVSVLDKDKIAGRKLATVQASPTPEPVVSVPLSQNEFRPVDIGKLDWWSRYGMTIFPMILAVLVTVALAICAGRDDQKTDDQPRSARMGLPSPQPAFKPGKDLRR